MQNVYIVQRCHNCDCHIVAVFSSQETARYHCEDMNNYLRSQGRYPASRYYYLTMNVWDTTADEMKKENAELELKLA